MPSPMEPSVITLSCQGPQVATMSTKKHLERSNMDSKRASKFSFQWRRFHSKFRLASHELSRVQNCVKYSVREKGLKCRSVRNPEVTEVAEVSKRISVIPFWRPRIVKSLTLEDFLGANKVLSLKSLKPKS
jgi:hypothetical protein